MINNSESAAGNPSDELNEYIESLIKGDRISCLRYVNNYMSSNHDYINLYEEVLKKALYEVGRMWEYNKITVASEHLATSITESLLNYIYEDLCTSGKIGKKIILACTEGEDHQVGIRMVSDVFEKAGWDTYFLGANMPVNELIMFIEKIQPHMIGLSLSVYFNLPNLEKMVRMIREVFPELPVIIGGQAFKHGGHEIILKYNDILFIPDLYSLELFIKSDADNGITDNTHTAV